MATVGHRRGVDDLPVDVRAVQEAGQSRARLAHAEGCARVEIDGERDVEPEPTDQLVELSARAEDRPLGGPDALGCAELDSRVPLAHLEHAGGHEPVTDAAGQAVDGGPDVDRAAELVEKRLVLGRLNTGSASTCSVTSTDRAGTPAASNAAERSATFGPQMRTPSRPSSRDPSSPSSRSHSARARTASRTSRSSSCPCRNTRVRPADCPDPGAAASNNRLNTAPLERIGRGEPADPSADDGDFVVAKLTRDCTAPRPVADTILARGQ